MEPVETTNNVAEPPRVVLEPMHNDVSRAETGTPDAQDSLQQFEFDKDSTVGTPEAAIAPQATHHGVTIGIAASLAVLFVSGAVTAYLIL